MTEFELVYSKEKLGRENFFYHRLINLVLWTYRRPAYDALVVAEREKGAPVTFPDVVRAF